MAYQEPQQGYAQGMNVTSQKWENGFWKCTPCGSCCLGCWCPCILYGRTGTRMKDPSMSSHTTCNSDCLVFGLINCGGCGWVLSMLRHGEIRKKHGIDGSGCKDCCANFCCPCLALLQQDNEIKTKARRGPITQGYQAQKEGMHMPPPAQAPAYAPQAPAYDAHAPHNPPQSQGFV